MNHLPLLDLFARAPSQLQAVIYTLAALVVVAELATILASRLTKLARGVSLAVEAWGGLLRQLSRRHRRDVE